MSDRSFICDGCFWEVDKVHTVSSRGKYSPDSQEVESIYDDKYCDVCYNSYAIRLASFDTLQVHSTDTRIIINIILRCTHMILEAITNIDRGKE